MIAAEVVEAVKARVALVELVGRAVRLRRSGREHKGLCPFHHERTPSFHVMEQRGLYRCYGCGASGDAVRWVMETQGVDFRRALEALAAEVGMADAVAGDGSRLDLRRARPPVARPDADQLRAQEAEDVGRARALWRSARPAGGTVVETYLREARAIDVARLGGMPRTLRFLPDAPYWTSGAEDRPVKLWTGPAMVAAVQAPDRRVTGVHITWLAPDGSGKADLRDPETGAALKVKKMRGVTWGGAVRFAPPSRVLALGEGIESTLSAPIVRPGLPAWCGLSLNHIAGGGLGRGPAHPERPGRWLPDPEPDPDWPGLVLPPEVEEVLVLGEATNGDGHAYGCLLERVRRRLARQGRTVRTLMPIEGDLNDWLRRVA